MQQELQKGDAHDDARLPARGDHPLAPAQVNPDRLTLLGAKDDDKAEDKEEFDLRRYWQILVKRKWTVMSAFGIVFLTVLIATLLMTPIYRASATLQIDRDTVKVMQVQGVNDESDVAYNDAAYYKTQYQLLQSIALSRRVASQLHLANDPSYLQLSDKSLFSRLVSMLSGKKEDPKAPQASDADSAALGTFVNQHLDVEPIRDTRLVTISFDSPNAGLSAKVANAVADNFIAANLEHSFNASAYARTYLEERLTQLKQKLTESQAKLVEIATKEKLFLDADGKTPLTSAELAALNTALATDEDVRLKAEARWKLVSGIPNESLPGDMLVNSIVGQLRQQRATIVADYQQKMSVYQPNYPLMLALKSQIDELDKQIAAEYAGVKSSIKSEYTAALAHENMLKAQMDQVKAQVLDQQQRSIAFNIAQRDMNTNQQLYDGLLQRYKEIGIAGGVTTNNMSIVDRADVPRLPYKPDLIKNLLLATIFGLALGVLLAFFFEYLDDTIKTPDDIEKLLGLAVLGVIPKLKGMTPNEATQDQRSPFSEAYRSVRTALQFSTAAGVPRSLLITSATPSEGKSTTAVTLANNFAQLGKSVLLIDGDLRNPSLHRVFGLENTNGLSNFLAGAIEPQDGIQNLPGSTLQVMTSGPLPPDPAELLAGPKLLSLLTGAIAKYDQVIIDAPPTIGLADALITSHVAIGTLFVIDSGATRREAARGAVKRLLSSRARIVGAVMTKYDSKMSGYGYGYGNYSYYAYGGSEQAKIAKQ